MGRRLLPVLLVVGILLWGTQAYWLPFVRLVYLQTKSAPTADSLPNPVEGHRFTDTWGAVRSGGRKHEGVDIFAPRGTPVTSTTPGMILRIGENSLGGRTVGIQGPGRTWHYYAHLESYADIRVYQWVEVGTIIGYVGDSGNAKDTPPHLHYGIYTLHGAVNPYPLINQDK